MRYSQGAPPRRENETGQIISGARDVTEGAAHRENFLQNTEKRAALAACADSAVSAVSTHSASAGGWRLTGKREARLCAPRFHPELTQTGPRRGPRTDPAPAQATTQASPRA